ncbi:hypothetical protein AGMMS49928_03630 [Spirochaetia bacterium]|nr:hypothetical protein AGMMS49928_03630 [Spirochaetia bacterium]
MDLTGVLAIQGLKSEGIPKGKGHKNTFQIVKSVGTPVFQAQVQVNFAGGLRLTKNA